MRCGDCGQENREGRKFCGGCGARLVAPCPECGTPNEPGERFCGECGVPLAVADAARARPTEGARKTVSIVFADLVGSTALHERLDPESARRFMERYYEAMRGAVEAHGGTVTQLLGDGVKAVFGVPRVAEDDAPRAVRAAAAMQERFRALAEAQRGAVGKTGLRVAVNTGEVVASDATEIIGDPVNVAARLQEQAGDGDVVVGETTHRLVAAQVSLELLGTFALKGRAESVKAYRLTSLERPAGAATAPFVGREEELARLASIYERAVGGPEAALAVVIGSPGLGKSRLIGELVQRHASLASVFDAQCVDARGATFAPLADALREGLGIRSGADAESLRGAVEEALPEEEPERGRIAAGVAKLLAGAPDAPEETFFVVRRLLAGLARARPVVLAIDDLQWAEPLLLDLVEHLIQWGGGVPLLVLVGARPELRQLRSSLATPGGLVSDVLTLGVLDAGAAMRLAANVLGAEDLPAAVAAKVLATSEGNPLFVGELIRMLVREGVLTREGDRWTAGPGLDAFEMPPTIHALLAARIERLPPAEREVLECAAVVGRHFSRSTVAALLPADAVDLDARLEALRRSELIERDTGWLLGEPVLRFHHVLIRDAAYRRLLKNTRAALHGRLADWIEARVGDAPEHDETIGWHLEQSHALLTELGPLDEVGRQLGARAAGRLSAAGRRALARDDVPLAAGLLGRAFARQGADDDARAGLVLDWCEALLAAGDVGTAATAIAELGQLGVGSERLRAWQTCFASQLTVLTEPSGLQAAAEAVAEAARQLTGLSDAAGEAKAHAVHAQALARLGRVGAAESALDHALAAARRAGDRRRANAVLAGAPLAALWGPSPVRRASGRCLDVVRVLRITQGAPAVEAVALSCQGVLEALRGRADAARRMLASARQMVGELGIASRLHEADVFAGRVELMEGGAPAAERLLRGAYHGLRDLGLGIDAAQAGALLARSVLAQGRVDEALELSRESEALAGDDLQAAIAWRGVRAEALARRGEHEEATRLAGAAVEIAAATDALLDHADARMALSAALRAAGREADAEAEARRATELWEAKGATLLVEHAARPDAPIARSAEVHTASGAAPRPRLRENAALAATMRMLATIEARDFAALRMGFTEDFRETNHPTGATYGVDGVIESCERLFRARDPVWANEPFATLGERLILSRRHTGASGTSSRRFDVGAFDIDGIHLGEVDENGMICRSELFDVDRLGDAVSRLYERHAELLPEGEARTRAEAIARSLSTLLRVGYAPDPDAFAEALDPELEWVDHKSVVGFGAGRGARGVLRAFASVLEVGEEIVGRVEDVLALTESALLLRWRTTGVAREGGGSFEWPLLRLFQLGGDGRVVRYEVFDHGREADALTCFDALVAGAAEPAAPGRRRVLPNTATASLTRLEEALAARDGDAIARLFDESLRVVHHPSGATYGRREMLATWRSGIRADRIDLQVEVLASLGERISLDRHLFSLEGLSEEHLAGFGPTELEEISLLRVDGRGRWVHFEIFAPDQLEKAVVRLYELYAESLPEGSERERATGMVRLLDALLLGPLQRDRIAAVVGSELEFADRRRLALLPVSSSREAFLRSTDSLLELSDDVTNRLEEVLALDHDAFVFRLTNRGTDRSTGSIFERHLCQLVACGADGLASRLEFFDVDCEADALARFDAFAGEERAGGIPDRFANSAFRSLERSIHCFNARDWDGMVATYAPSHRMDDRRRLMRIGVEGREFFENERWLFELPGSAFGAELLATRGERLALCHVRFTAEGEGAGPMAVEMLDVVEVDATGRRIALVVLDPDDLDAAHAELEARFLAGEGAEHAWVQDPGWRERDWETIGSAYAPDFELHDHRVLGWGVQPLAGWLDVARALVDLAPDTRMVDAHIRICAGGALTVRRMIGTREGGPFELGGIGVIEIDPTGRRRRTDMYDFEDIDRARARFAEIASGPNRDPLEAFSKPNAATPWLARLKALVEAQDWDGVPALCAEGMVWEDRRRMFQIAGGPDLMISSIRERAAAGARLEHFELLGSAGDRVCAWRVLWAGGPAEGRFEMEYLVLVEVDEAGLATGLLLFDLDDLAAVRREGWARWTKSDPEVAPAAVIDETLDAFNAQDRARIREFYVEDLSVEDHRLAGMGRIEGVDPYLDSIVALWNLTPVTQVELPWLWPLARPGAALTLIRRFGDVAGGGGPFESEYLQLAAFRDGRITRVELFDPSDLDTALLRFAEP